MISPKEIRKKATSKYTSFLTAFVNDGPFFPLEIRFRKAKASDDYNRLNKWVSTLKGSSKAEQGFGYTLTLQERNHRRYGRQSLPNRIAFETADDYLKFIGKADEFKQVQQAISHTQQRFPQLIKSGWMGRYPQRLVANLADWPALLEVCGYFVNHPRPNLYMREIPVEVHSKFIESHQGILRHLLDELLPPEAISPDETAFAPRYGLRYDEPQIRFRLLDERLIQAVQWPTADLTFKLSDCAAADFWGSIPLNFNVIIVENKMTFLTLPPVKNGIAIWGKGFQVGTTGRIAWLQQCQIWYWGDLDAQGFEILSQLRSHYPQTISFLMDTQTLERYADFIVTGTATTVKQLPHLTQKEQPVYTLLAERNRRLEQERVLHGEVVEVIAQIVPT